VKRIGKFLAISLMSALLLFGTLIVSGHEPYEGCRPCFWARHQEAWKDTGYTPNMLVGDIFNVPPEYNHLADDTLLQALRYRVLFGADRLAKLLIRQGIAGVLNSAHPDVNYIYTLGDVQWLVNYPLKSGDPAIMREWMNLLREQNILGCVW
jgi:hypothetical protein